MAVNLGLILGSALAGAAAGGGDAAEKMGASMQDAQQKQDLVRMQAQLDEQKQMRIQEAEHNFQNQFQQNAFTQQDKTLDKTQDFTSGENQLNRESEEKRSAGNNATSLAVANISAGSAQTVEAMRAAAMKEVQQQSAKGFQIVQGADGAFVSVDKVNGSTSPILVNGQPLIGAKNVDSATAMAAAALLKPDPMDSEADQKRKQQMAYQMLGIDKKLEASGNGSFPRPSPEAIKLAKSGGVTQAQWDAKFGAGAFARDTGGQPAAPTSGASGTPGIPGTPDTGAGTTRAPLINGNVPQQPAPAVQGVPVNNSQFAQGGSRLPAPPAPAVQPAAAPAPYQPSALIANAMTPQTGAPPTQPAFRQQLDAFGRPVQQGVQNPLGL
jgi:hypothetical protein